MTRLLGTCAQRGVTPAAILLTAVGIYAIVGMGSAAAAEITPPQRIAEAGKIRYCTDIGTPPLEFFDQSNKPVGSDIDLGTEIARRMGVEVEWVNTPFSGIVPALLAKQCDAIISQLFDKPARREVIDFVDYMNSSQSIVVRAGNPHNIKTLADLSGRKVAVQNGTTIQSLLDDENGKLKAAGKPAAEVVVFPKDTDALQSLQIGQVDAYGTTLETAAYYFTKAPGVFEVAGPPFNQILTGMGIRKDDAELKDAIKKALAAMKADGTYLKILDKWGLKDDALP